MISHKHKCIFIHIPKTAGTSINEFFHPGVDFKVLQTDYERLFGWCPKRKIHLQHATARQLLETKLVTEEQWNSYFKFTFVRNPWNRAYSDYYWMKKYAKVCGNFSDYLNRKNEFRSILTDSSNHHYIGDHLMEQTRFFEYEGNLKPDFIGRFENFNDDIDKVLQLLSVNEKFTLHKNKGNTRNHYSNFYTGSMKKLVDSNFPNDIATLGYTFEDKRKGIKRLKQYF